jgi:hypothetical protein
LYPSLDAINEVEVGEECCTQRGGENCVGVHSSIRKAGRLVMGVGAFLLDGAASHAGRQQSVSSSSIVVREKLRVAGPIKKFPAFYGTFRFIAI